MKKWFPLFITVVAGAVAATSPEVQAKIADHPEVATVLITAFTVIQALTPSPLQPQK